MGDENETVLPDETVVLALSGDGKTQVVIPGRGRAISPFGWGILLNDIARNAARAVAGENPGDQAEFLAALKRGFDAEWADPTDWPVG